MFLLAALMTDEEKEHMLAGQSTGQVRGVGSEGERRMRERGVEVKVTGVCSYYSGDEEYSLEILSKVPIKARHAILISLEDEE